MSDEISGQPFIFANTNDSRSDEIASTFNTDVTCAINSNASLCKKVANKR